MGICLALRGLTWRPVWLKWARGTVIGDEIIEVIKLLWRSQDMLIFSLTVLFEIFSSSSYTCHWRLIRILQSRFKQFWSIIPEILFFHSSLFFIFNKDINCVRSFHICIYRMVKITIKGELVVLNTRFPVGVKGYEI